MVCAPHESTLVTIVLTVAIEKGTTHAVQAFITWHARHCRFCAALKGSRCKLCALMVDGSFGFEQCLKMIKRGAHLQQQGQHVGR